MKENSFRYWQILTAILTSIMMLITVVVTIIHFNKSQAEQFRAVEKQIESQREESKEININNFQNAFWQKQLELYIEVSTIAAELTQFELDSKEYSLARKGFFKLFWGPMSIVEDSQVKKAMEGYSSQLSIYENTRSKVDLDMLKQKSFQLARTCRESSIKRWDLKEFELE